MAMYKICSSCGTKIEYNSKCSCINKEQKERYKHYSKFRNDKEVQKFYASKAWRNIRKVILDRFKGMCLLCLYDNNEIVPAKIVHHIMETKQDDQSWLDDNNLILLCNGCHEHIHSVYNASDTDRLEMQDKLLELSEQFNKDFNGY